jgi:hypothetical protein
MPCCHCVSFTKEEDRPLKKRLLTFSSNHNVDIAKPYKCHDAGSEASLSL